MPREQEPPEKEPLFGDIGVELQNMVEDDQQVRREQRWDDAEKIDQRNADRLKQIVATIGWPTTTRVGPEAAHAAWLIVQHADTDPAWQAKCLELMKETGQLEVSAEDIAYLDDRVLVATGKPQRYGTQFVVNEQGEYGPEEIEDMEHLDERRAKAGMNPFREYKAALEEAWAQSKAGQSSEHAE